MEKADILEALADQLGDRHIMLSYQWDNQELVKKVYHEIDALGVEVWMDICGGISGSISEAMAAGVEGAGIICCFMSQKYETSKNCSAELNYANDRGSTIVPCMVQSRTDAGNPYRASGWLGIITAGKLWIDFKSDEDMPQRTIQLLRECCNRLIKAEEAVGKMKYLKDRMSQKKKPARIAGPRRKLPVTQPTVEGTITLPDQPNITIPLNQPLVPGDQIEVWGEFKEGPKYNFNLIGDDPSQCVLHFDIRPQEGAIVMNSKKEKKWQTEIRNHTAVRNFLRGVWDAKLHLVVRYEGDRLVFFVNGERLPETFPVRIPLKEGRNVLFSDEGGLGRFKAMKIPEPKGTAEGKDCVPIIPNTKMILEEALKVGDIIGVWGVYQEGAKYNFNIKRNKDDYLLHFDIRPSEASLCIDAKINGKWGVHNIHLKDQWRLLAHSTKDGSFNIEVKLQEEGMDLFVNGEQICSCNTLTYAFDLSTANYIMCTASEGQRPWTSIMLPKAQQLLQSYSVYELDTLNLGDVINFTGRFRQDETYGINIMESITSLQLHIAIRPQIRTIVLNSITNGAWDAEVISGIPSPLMDCQYFDVFVLVEEAGYKVDFSEDQHNHNVLLSMYLPHRSSYKLAKYIKFRDVNDNVWNELHMPNGTSYLKEL